MKKFNLSIILFGVLAFSSLTNANIVKELKYGDYDKNENAYFVKKIEEPSDLIKAHKFVTPTDNKYSTQKTRSLGQSLIGDIESVWDSYTGKGTTIAIIDDGFDYNHPEYLRSDGTSAILSTSRYYYTSGSNAYYKSYSDDPTCIAEDYEDGEDPAWATHGTNTSTTAAAPMNNGGGVGVAPDADILALKIDFSFVAIKAAIQYAIAQKVDVINMSLGAYAENFTDGFGDSQKGYSSTETYLDSVCQSAYDAGIIVVAAAGNEATYHKSYPACNTKVIGVGALGDYKNKGNATSLAEFTNYVSSSQTGEINVDILAPGYVYTATQSGNKSSISHTYNDTQGTSFSSPIVAGAAALWKEKYPKGTPDEFLSALQESADDIGEYKNKYVPVSGWSSSSKDVGPSNIEAGRLNVANLLDISKPFVTVKQSSISLSIDETKQIDLDAYNGSITYSSSDENIAIVSNSGLVKGVSKGETTIKVIANKNGESSSVEIPVTVSEKVAISSLSFNPSSITLEVGNIYDSEKIVEVNPLDASRIFLFESEDEDIATVDIDTGVITARKEGKTKINVIALYGEGENTLDVTVIKSSEPISWTKISSNANLSDGEYLITCEDGNVIFNGGLETLDVMNNNISVTISNKSIKSSTNINAASFTYDSNAKSLKSKSGNYIGQTTNANGLSSSSSTIYTNTISFDNDGNANIVSSGGAYLRYNSSNDQNRFRYYKSSSYSSQKAVQLYKADYGSSTLITVSEVVLSSSNLSLDVYSNPTAKLIATVNGTNNPSQNVTWSTSDSSIVSVNDGTITALKQGSATITATSIIDNSKYATCYVSVTDSTPITLSSISISGQKTSFKLNDSFTFGGTVTANYNNSSSKDVTSLATFSGYDMSKEGTYDVIVSYTEGEITKTTTYQIIVSSSISPVVESNIVTYEVKSSTSANLTSGTAPSGSSINFKNTYSTANQITSGNSQTWTLKGYENYTLTSIKADMKRNSSKGYGTLSLTNNGTSISLNKNISTASELTSSFAEYELLSSDFLCSGDIVLTISASENSVYCDKIILNYELDVSDKIINKISASYSGGDIFINENLDTSKITVVASFLNNKYKDESLNSSDYSLSNIDTSTSGTKVVVVTYIGSLSTSESPLTTSFEVMVKEDSITDIIISNENSYHPGETIKKADITVTLIYESGKSLTTNDFEFLDDGYMFTYLDAPSGGEEKAKQFAISFNEKMYDFEVYVSRIAYKNILGEEINISSSQFNNSNISKSSSTSSSNSVTISGIKFVVSANAYIYTSSNVSYLSFGKNAGYIQNEEAFLNDLISINIKQKSGARQDGVLYISKDGNDFITYSSEEIAKGGYRYFKYSYNSSSSSSGASSYSNIESISYVLSGQDNVINVSNYIMYEDTNGQCETKLDIALEKLNSLSSEDKKAFLDSSTYVIYSARTRLFAWAESKGKTISFIDNQYELKTRNNVYRFIESKENIIPIIIISSSLIASFISGCYIYKRRKN